MVQHIKALPEVISWLDSGSKSSAEAEDSLYAAVRQALDDNTVTYPRVNKRSAPSPVYSLSVKRYKNGIG